MSAAIWQRLHDALAEAERVAGALEDTDQVPPGPRLHTELQGMLRRLTRRVGQLGRHSGAGDPHDASLLDSVTPHTLSQIVDHLPAMLFLKEPQGLRMVLWNRAGEELVGIPRESMVGKTDFDFFPPEQAAFFVGNDRKVLAGEPSDVEEPIDTPNGRRWLHTRKVALLDEAGRPLFLLGVSLDITERRRLEQRIAERTAALERSNLELTHARDLFRSLFHASPIAAAISNLASSALVEVNARYLEFFGLRREEAIGHNPVELGLWADPSDRERIGERVIREGTLREFELAVRTRRGETRTVLVSIEVLDYDGEPSVLSLFVDITERVAAESRVRALSGALTLAEQRERRRISQMLHDDLQQVLFGLEMRFHLLERALAQSEVHERGLEARLADVEGLTRRAIELTRTLSLELDPPVLRDEGLGAALSWLAAHMQARYGLEVELELEPGLEVEGADQRALVIQLVRELLFNVVQHAHTRTARMRAWCAPPSLFVEVSDQGRGFDVASTRLQGRTTFGLRTVRERLELFGGELELDAQPGHGTRVRIRVPSGCTGEAQRDRAPS